VGDRLEDSQKACPANGKKLAEPSTDPAVIEAAALAVLGKFTTRRAVRLVGARVEYAG
jgi:hypothetical protein